MLIALLWNLLLTAGLGACCWPWRGRFSSLRQAAGAETLALAAAVGQACHAAADCRAAPARDCRPGGTRPRCAPSAQPAEHREAAFDPRAADFDQPAVAEMAFVPAGRMTWPTSPPKDFHYRRPGAFARRAAGGLVARHLRAIDGSRRSCREALSLAKPSGNGESPCWRSPAPRWRRALAVRGLVRSCVVDARTTPLLWGGAAVGGGAAAVHRRPQPAATAEHCRPRAGPPLAPRPLGKRCSCCSSRRCCGGIPVVWWADRELRAAKDSVATRWPSTCCKANRRSYATTLLKALDFIQAEPLALAALATGMGSKGTILRRFEMIGETRLSYQLSRWTFLACWSFGDSAGLHSRARPGEVARRRCRPASGGRCQGRAGESRRRPRPPLDPKIKELGEAVHKRLTTWTDTETLLLKDGQTARMKVKKNITPVAEIQITPHFVEHGTMFDLEGVDAAAKTIEGTKCTSMVIHNAEGENMGLGKDFVGGRRKHHRQNPPVAQRGRIRTPFAFSQSAFYSHRYARGNRRRCS